MKNLRRSESDRNLSLKLSPALKVILKIFLVLAGFMIANTMYLILNRLADTFNWPFFATSDISLPKLLQVMVLTHTGVGLLLAVITIGFVFVHLSQVWRRRHRGSLLSGILIVTSGLILSLSGLLILTAAASRDNSYAWWIHVLCSLLVVCGYIVHRFASYNRPPVLNFVKYGAVTVSLVTILVVIHSFTHLDLVRTSEAQMAFEKGLNDGPGAKNRNTAKLSDKDFVPTGFVPPASPFFPSPATTTTGGFLPSRIITRDSLISKQNLIDEIQDYGFVKETQIGAETCNRCHQDIVAQWAASAHRFASFNNPFYEATIDDMRKNALEPNEFVEEHVRYFPRSKNQVGKVKSKWCSGCHDPALMLAGKMDQEIDRTWLESQAGLTCLSCHSIDQIHNQTGNGNYNIADEQEDPYLFADAKTNTIKAFLHDAALKAKPAVHKRQMQKPFFLTSEYCATCHKVSLSEPVNNYRWLRGQDEYDNWHDSGVSLNASRTFYLPPFKRECQDCHMPPEQVILGDVAAKNGVVKSHRFLAANTALPLLRGDQETIDRTEDFLQNNKLRVDIFALKSESMSQASMAIDHNNVILKADEKVIIDVVVRNLGVGHTFPGGTNDSNESWLEFSINDKTGNVLTISGRIDENGHVDPMAHTFKSVLLDNKGNPIIKRNAQDIHVSVFDNVIGPGTADIAHYEFVVPSELAGKILTLRAQLLWRKFNRQYTEFAFNANPAGFTQFPDIPELPITEIASHQVDIGIAPLDKNRSLNSTDSKVPEWIRYNDYGIGLLMEGDTRGAALAFEKVALLEPALIEGPLNLAKTSVQDGNIKKTYQYLMKCEKLKPGEPRVAWVWAVALQEGGLYDKAIQAYQRVLQAFPDDRAAWRNLGRTYYLNQQYDKALQAFSKVLMIDPEDRIAHYHRMLCFRALGKHQEAEKVSTAYEFYKIDESAQQITRNYRLKNPGDNLMSQSIRIHKLTFTPPNQPQIEHNTSN